MIEPAILSEALYSPSEASCVSLRRGVAADADDLADCWRGVAHVVTGMNRQGYWLHLSNVDAGTWRATFSRDAMTSADGFGSAETPWRAVQRAAWAALAKAPRAS